MYVLVCGLRDQQKQKQEFGYNKFFLLERLVPLASLSSTTHFFPKLGVVWAWAGGCALMVWETSGLSFELEGAVTSSSSYVSESFSTISSSNRNFKKQIVFGMKIVQCTY
jgi:hypothetical protein